MAKVKGMNRTAGTARRKMSASERVSYGLKTGAPLTGSASGVKSINLRQAGEVLTQGIVSARGKKLSFDPAGLAMALPVGKLAKAAKALRVIGRKGPVTPLIQAAALENRIGSKIAGRAFGKSLAKRKSGGGPILGSILGAGRTRRAASEKVFPRAAGPGTTVRRGRGTVDQEGLEKMIAGGREPSRDMLRIPQILNATNKAYESIAQKAIKAAGKTPKRPRGK